MNEELLKKISELIEKIDCLAGKTLDVKRQECAHDFEGVCTTLACVTEKYTESSVGPRKNGWRHGRCKFCGIRMTEYHTTDDYYRKDCAYRVGWPDGIGDLEELRSSYRDGIYCKILKELPC